MPQKRKICFVSGTRADYGLLFWLMKEFQADTSLGFQLIVTGTHVSRKFGYTVTHLIKDGFKPTLKVDLKLKGDSLSDMAEATGRGVIGFTKALRKLRPDAVVLLGDRFETLSAAQAAYILGIKVIHIHGGDTTQGALDEGFRHAITKLSDLHLVTCEPYRRRVIQLGEQPQTVHTVGSPGVENFLKLNLMTKKEIEQSLGFSIQKPLLLITYHSTTQSLESDHESVKNMLKVISEQKNATAIFTLSNSDAGNRKIRTEIENFCRRNSKWAFSFETLGQKRYLSIMAVADLVLGNSSSGVIEAPSKKVVCINIGERQKGRIMAASVLSCGGSYSEIKKAVTKGLNPSFKKSLLKMKSPYGEGGFSERSYPIIKSFLSRPKKMKKFYDL